MSMYLWSMLAGSVLVFALYGLRCAKAVRLPVLRQRAWETALLSFVFSVLFGTVLARVGYAVLMQELDFEYDGIEALTLLLEFEINVVSFSAVPPVSVSVYCLQTASPGKRLPLPVWMPLPPSVRCWLPFSGLVNFSSVPMVPEANFRRGVPLPFFPSR